jgi:ATP-binding cassette subfamily C protein LapB
MSRDQKRGTWRTIRRLEKSIPQIRWYRGELVLMSLFVNIFALGLPVFILQVYDRVLPNLGLTTMQFLVVGLIAVMLLDFFLKTARAAVTTYTGARFEHLARVSAVDHILRTPQDVYENDTPGAYLDKVNAIGVVKEFYSSQLGTLMIDLPFAVFFLGMIWFLGGIMVAVPLVLLTLFGIMAILVGGNLRRAVDMRSQVDNRRYDFLIEIINGIHTVKAQAFKNLLQRRFDPMQEMSARAVRSVAMQSSIAQSLGSTFGQLNMACVIGTGAILVIDGALSAGELAACTLLSGRAMQPLQSAMGLWTNFQSIRVACDNAASVLELPAEDMSHLPEMPPLKGNLEFRNVTFGYDGMDEPLIRNLSLSVKPGEMIGIDGDNSSGRSTLLKLMMGLIRPNDGAVLLDDHNLTDHQSQSYRLQMAFLTADSDVYSGTILDNMTYFRGGKYIGKAMKIAKQLGLDEEIKRLPEGYGTHVGDGAGGVLPAGFIQRITVIRAMIDDPKIVLFDNANHGLDSNSDKTLMEYINSLRGKTTVILVTSRPSWLRMSDRRYVMSSGDLQPLPESEQQPRLEKPAPALPAPTTAPISEQQTAETAAPAPQTKPTAQPQARPAPAPAPAPQAKPTVQPQARPAPAPQAKPTAQPKARPTTTPQAKPAAQPQAKPTAQPQARPAPAPQAKPTAQPQARPAPAPQAKPNAQPQARPASAPQAKPAAQPQARPAPAPQAKPTAQPQARPAPAPQAKPTTQPQARPAPAPQAKPTAQPQARPAPAPQAKPTAQPQARPKPAPQTTPAAQPQARPTPTPAKQAPRPAPQARPKSAPQPAPPTRGNPPNNAQQQANRATFTPAPAVKKPAPKPAATLRAATTPGSSTQPRRRASTKPEPPKARRTATFQPTTGGAE